MTKRFNKHVTDARRDSPYAFHRAIRKYGEDCWDSTVLAECASLHSAQLLEQEHILKYNTFGKGGYNMTAGGGGTIGRHMSEEAKQKARDRQLLFNHSDESKVVMKQKFTHLRGRKVAQYDISGKFLRTFDSCVEAAEHLGNRNLQSSINQLCGGTHKHNQNVVRGYAWKFYSGDDSDIPPIEDRTSNRYQTFIRRAALIKKTVYQFTVDGACIAIFDSIKSASCNTGIYESGISRCCRGILLTAGGFVWKFTQRWS